MNRNDIPDWVTIFPQDRKMRKFVEDNRYSCEEFGIDSWEFIWTMGEYDDVVVFQEKQDDVTIYHFVDWDDDLENYKIEHFK